MDMKIFKRGQDVEGWVEKFSKMLADNPWFEKLLLGKLVPKQEKSTINSNGYIDGDLHVTGNCDIDLTLNVDGAADLNSTLNVDGASTMRGGAVIGPATGPRVDINAYGNVYIEVGDGQKAIDIGYGASLYGNSVLANGVYGSCTLPNSTLNGLTVINESGNASSDTRIEGDTNTTLVFVDASTDRVGIGTSTPEVLFDVRGVSRYGDGITNYSEFEADGTLEFNGAATVWDDLRAEPVARVSGTGVPSREEWFDATGLNVGTAGVGDIHLYSFTDESVAGNEKELRFQFQFPHSWAGTSIYPHVHWVGDTAGTSTYVRWGLQYTWADIGTDFGGTTTIYSTTEKIGASGASDANITAARHYITPLPSIAPSASQDGISSILLCRLFRNSSNAADTYTGGKAGLLYLDIHMEINTIGSRSEFTK